MSQTTRLVTAVELAQMGEDTRYELVRGQLVAMSPVDYGHGASVVELIFLLRGYLADHPLGGIVTEVGFVLESNPDTVRAPDIAFVRTGRVPALKGPGFSQGCPDLAIEVLSPDDRAGEIAAKVDQYLSAGVSVVIVMDPRKKSAIIHRPSAPPVILGGDDAVLEIDDVLPGFRCTLGEIFK